MGGRAEDGRRPKDVGRPMLLGVALNRIAGNQFSALPACYLPATGLRRVVLSSVNPAPPVCPDLVAVQQGYICGGGWLLPTAG